jgi:hypothetical protein
MAETYRKNVLALCEALTRRYRLKAAEALRALIAGGAHSVGWPDAGRSGSDVCLCFWQKETRLGIETGSQFSLVAGAGFDLCRTRFRLRPLIAPVRARSS